jgi:hypothetical protein
VRAVVDELHLLQKVQNGPHRYIIAPAPPVSRS